jgi:hypothetical protein
VCEVVLLSPDSFTSFLVLAQMPLATVDGSSAMSESRKVSVNSRDGGLCVLCGMDPVDIAHIVAGKSGDHRQVRLVDSCKWLNFKFIHELIG